MRTKLKRKVRSETYNYNRTVDSTSTEYLKDDYFEKMSTKTDYTYSRSPSYRRKVESPYYQIPNMSRAHVRGKAGTNVTSDLYVSSDDEDINYITKERLSTRTVYEDGILLRSGNNLRNARMLTERHNVKNRRSLQALNTNKNAREVRRSLHSVNTMEDSRLSRSTTRGSRSRRSQASDYVTSTNRITGTASSSASLSSYTSSSKSSVLEPVRKTLISEFDDLEMEKGMKEIQNSNRKIKLYGLDQVDSDEMSGMESESEFTGTNMSGYRSNSRYSRSSPRRSRSDTTTSTTTSASDSSTSMVTTVTTTVVTTIIETITSTARPVAQPLWNNVGRPMWTSVGRPVWNRVGEPAWRYLGRPVWRYLVRPVCSLTSSLLSVALLMLYHLIWTYCLRHIVKACTFVTRKTLSTARAVVVKMVVWEVGLFSRMSRLSRLCCIILPLMLLLPLLFYAVSPFVMHSNLMEMWKERSYGEISGVGKGLSPHELREHVRRIVIQIDEGRENSLSMPEVESIVSTMVEQRLNEEKLANQNRWLEEQEAAKNELRDALSSVKTNSKEEEKDGPVEDINKSRISSQGPKINKSSVSSGTRDLHTREPVDNDMDSEIDGESQLDMEEREDFVEETGYEEEEPVLEPENQSEGGDLGCGGPEILDASMDDGGVCEALDVQISEMDRSGSQGTGGTMDARESERSHGVDTGIAGHTATRKQRVTCEQKHGDNSTSITGHSQSPIRIRDIYRNLMLYPRRRPRCERISKKEVKVKKSARKKPVRTRPVQPHLDNIPAPPMERTNLTEEILRVLQQLNVGVGGGTDTLTEGDVRAIASQLVQREVSGLQDRITEQTQAKMSGSGEQEKRILNLQNDLKTSIVNLEQKLTDELDRMKSESVRGGEGVGDEAAATLVQIQEDLSSVRARLDSLELEKRSLAGQVKNCCRNDSFYTALVQDRISLILGQIMSGNDSGSADQYTFGAWLKSTYIKKSDLEEYMAEFSQGLTEKIMKEIPQTEATEVYVSESGVQGKVTEMAVRQIVTEALEKFSADKIAMPDFALESAGGSIISTKCSETFHKNTARLSILGIPLWYVSNSPRSVIQPEMQPGSCWAFQGRRGHLVIELSANITPTAFTLEHIPKSIAPEGKIDSAPKEFTVLGLSNEFDTVGSNLGNFTYNESGPPLQTFSIKKPNVGNYKFVQLSVLENHGNPLYTCIYRFRVHGIPYKPKKK
uniref:SUN domain-containing protein n=1 Tax=Magallana gigas TaxID=29159 RepID=A0A8W8LT56_MAGGI